MGRAGPASGTVVQGRAAQGTVDLDTATVLEPSLVAGCTSYRRLASAAAAVVAVAGVAAAGA